MASTQPKSAISDYRKSNPEAVTNSRGIRSTLLVHPHGIKVLEEYKKIMDEGLSKDENILAKKLATELERVVYHKETVISKTIKDALVDNWNVGSTTGEKQESVQGESQGVTLTGDPDVVLRVRVALKEEGEEDEEKDNMVSSIFEIAVDDNGGEKKHLQAYDYARFIGKKPETFLFFVMRVDRKQTGCDVAITQESFFYNHDADKKKRKYGFLWREFYHAKKENGSKLFQSMLNNACEGIVRSVHCSTFLQELPPHEEEWKMFHSNVAVEGSKSVYKVFDNRFMPTERKVENWVGRKWTSHLEVENYLVYEESPGARSSLGKPNGTSACKAKETGHDNPSPRKKHKTAEARTFEQMPYGTGSIVIIRYKYQNGTHIASKLSHFQAIARSIKDMHELDMVHGDIRGHNLLHPHPGKVDGSITKSCLIDFDFSGKATESTYPLGLNSAVPENLKPRNVKAKQVMEKIDDWEAFGSTLGVYDPLAEGFHKKWVNIAAHFYFKKVDLKNPTKALDDFFDEYGDVEVELQEFYKPEFVKPKGTGSPVELKARGRFSASNSISASVSQEEA